MFIVLASMIILMWFCNFVFFIFFGHLNYTIAVTIKKTLRLRLRFMKMDKRNIKGKGEWLMGLC